MTSPRRPRVGLALGGGGDAGVAYAIGCISALAEESGWDSREAEYVVGTSAGSLVATALRVDVSPSDLAAAMGGGELSADAATKINDKVLGTANDIIPPVTADAFRNTRLTSSGLIATTAMNPRSARPVALAAAAMPEGRFTHTYVRNKILHLAGEEWPERELLLTATRMDNGRRAVFTKDSQVRTDLPTAAAASCAIPAVFNPVEIDGVRYIDGGMYSSTNADLLARYDLDVVIIVPPLSTMSRLPATKTMPLRSTIRMMSVREQQQLRAQGTQVLTMHPGPEAINAMGLNFMDVTKRQPVMEAAKYEAHELLRTAAAQPVIDLLVGRQAILTA